MTADLDRLLAALDRAGRVTSRARLAAAADEALATPPRGRDSGRFPPD
ncbi:hypothetical protein ACT8ZV_02355 [Nocardioides sp. MAHUQ-72]